MPQKARKDPLEDFETLVAGLREAATRPVRTPLLAALESTIDEAREIRENREIFRAATKDARQCYRSGESGEIWTFRSTLRRR